MQLKYGKKNIQIPINDNNILKLLHAKQQTILSHPVDRLKALLQNPTNSSSLNELITKKQVQNVLIIVNDITRPTPYDVILPPLLESLHLAGIQKENIRFVIATGSHRGNTLQEIRNVFGKVITSEYSFINHDDRKSPLKDFGCLKSGNQLLVNSLVVEADFVITTGVIVPHYFAGFSGGRKSILPGICGRQTIEANHSHMAHPDARAGNLKGNPVHEEMQEAAGKVGVDFNINVITDEHHQIIEIVAGELSSSWQQGVEMCKKTYLCPIPHKADIVIASPGGYPKDINVYQAQKALDNAYQAVNPGGTIILLAECPEGYGQSTFAKWIEEATSIVDVEKRFQAKFVLGGHKAYSIARVTKEVEVLFISSLPHEQVRKLFFTPVRDINQALEYVKRKHGEDFKAYILPLGNTVLPQVEIN